MPQQDVKDYSQGPHVRVRVWFRVRVGAAVRVTGVRVRVRKGRHASS